LNSRDHSFGLFFYVPNYKPALLYKFSRNSHRLLIFHTENYKAPRLLYKYRNERRLYDMAIEIFTRREQKYLITIKQYKALIERISLYMRPDLNGVNGRYTVTSLYFDNAQHSIYFETKNKLRFRQKLRLRVYDETD